MLIITTWKWGTKYSADDVHKLSAGVKRHLKQPHRFICITDDTRGLKVECATIRDMELTQVRGCFARLRLFDPEAQKASGILTGERIANLDLDLIVTGPLDPVFDRPEPFVILQGANSINPCNYNGSIFMLRAGAHPEVWRDFSFDAARRMPFFEFPDDQGWLWHKVPDAAGWKAGESGVYAFQKPGWPKGDDLPSDARIVAFPGWRDPAKFSHLDWVRQNWR